MARQRDSFNQGAPRSSPRRQCSSALHRIVLVLLSCQIRFGTPEGTRTPDLLLRRQLLYPAELLAHMLERVTGIGPAYPAWKAGVLPLNYTRESSYPGQFSYTILAYQMQSVKAESPEFPEFFCKSRPQPPRRRSYTQFRTGRQPPRQQGRKRNPPRPAW